jgi:hypothetical protein
MMRSCYAITVNIPVDLDDFKTMGRVSAVHQGIKEAIEGACENWHERYDIEVSEPKHIRKRVPAQSSTAAAESSAPDVGGSPEPTSEGTGTDTGFPSQAVPAADEMPPIPENLRRVPR